ncbi:restriction endonuclease subunit S [Pedobacter namyangjuensis]|uniref:restriction endonuclease subunit S n=1 Tax=Pedobacter namyangjuensis TaxID=600626 RepID=UPI000DE2BBC4|nr:restriction endonuclease subunit S [Pedobacter namyangjuensis]
MKEVSLKEYIQEISMGPFGSNIKIDNFISSGVPVLNGSNLTNHKLVEHGFKYVSEKKANSLGKANAKRGDIVITHRGTLGQVAYIPFDSKFERYVISQSQFRVRFKDSINPIYFAYLMLSKYGQKKLLSFKNHVGVPALAQATTNFKLLKLFIPDILTQNKIASVLSALDDKIELNNKINAELEAMAKTLYDYWFVQFDFPGADGKPYKTSGGEMVYSEVLKREIPKGWTIEKLSSCCEIVDCLHSKKSDYYYENEACYLLQLENIKDDGLIDVSSKYFVSKDEYERWTKRIEVKDHDLVITNAGRVASLSQIPKNMVAGIGRNITAIRPKTIDPTFLYYSFQGAEMKRQIIINTDNGTFFQSLNVRGIKELLVTRPPNYLEDNFEKLALNIRRKRELNNQQNQELASLRDWLLPMLMNGQVTVKYAYEMVGEELGMVAEGK